MSHCEQLANPLVTLHRGLKVSHDPRKNEPGGGKKWTRGGAEMSHLLKGTLKGTLNGTLKGTAEPLVAVSAVDDFCVDMRRKPMQKNRIAATYRPSTSRNANANGREAQGPRCVTSADSTRRRKATAPVTILHGSLLVQPRARSVPQRDGRGMVTQ